MRSGRWQRLQRGVYATFSGEPTRQTALWAALLRAGPGAVLSHQTAAIGRRRTTADRIRQAMDARKKTRWRRELVWALDDAGDGVLSVLEYRYVHRVERPHGLPAARRQVRIRQRTGNKYLDNLYQEYGVCSELDGTAAHSADEQWRDKRRDNANAARGIVTLRFGLLDLGDRRCQTAADVAAVLRLRGWTGVGRPCPRPACALRDAVS